MSNIWIPNRKILTLETQHQTAISGQFRMEAFKCWEYADGTHEEIPGTRRILADWFDNLILNQGLEYYGAGTPGGVSLAEFCHVGTSSAAEAETQTALVAWVAYSGIDLDNSVYWAQATPPYYGARRFGYRFNAGFGGGAINLNEVGVGCGTTVGSQFLTSRSLTKDGAGTPTTVSVLADEYLDVYYTRRNYPTHIVEATGATNDGSGTVLVGATSYNYTVRPGRLTDNDWGQEIMYPFTWTLNGFGAVGGSCSVYGNGAVLGPVTGNPTGAASTDDNAGETNTMSSYVTGTYNREVTNVFGPSSGNVTGGIKALMTGTSMGCYQFLFNNSIPKDGGNSFNWVQYFTWTRKTLP